MPERVVEILLSIAILPLKFKRKLHRRVRL